MPVPPTEPGDALQIEDRYLDGTRLRLRRVGDAGSVVFKLGQKVRAVADDPSLVWVTTLYLTEQEHRRLSALPAAVLTKTRRRVDHRGTIFAVDEFAGDLRGLVLAETELPGGATGGRLELPPWLGREVSSDERYTGAALARDGLPAGWRTGG